MSFAARYTAGQDRHPLPWIVDSITVELGTQIVSAEAGVGYRCTAACPRRGLLQHRDHHYRSAT